MVFVGYQAEGSLGRRLLDGAKSVKLFGEDIAVRARVITFHGLSSHADRDHLLDWLDHFKPAPDHIFVVHGDPEVSLQFSEHLKEKGLSAHMPRFQEGYDLLENRILEEGIVIERKKSALAVSPAYLRLQDTARMLEEVIARSNGRTNKDLAKLADQLKNVIEKWDS